MTNDIRWKQRFSNFTKAHLRLLEAATANKKDPSNTLIQMALIQSFEFTYELGWKVMKDYLKHNGVEATLPREVIKAAFQYGILEDGQAWIDMMEDRNLMAHTYDDAKAELAIQHICQKYLKSITQVYTYFNERNH